MLIKPCGRLGIDSLVGYGKLYLVIPVNVNEEEEEITDEVYELKRREKGKIVEESRNTPFHTPIRSPRIHTDLVSSDIEKLQELTVTDTTLTPSTSSLNTKLSTTNRLLSLFKAKLTRFKRYKNFFQELWSQDTHIKEQVEKQVPEQVKVQVLVYVAKGMLLERQQNKEETDKMIAKVMLKERGKLQAKNFLTDSTNQDDPHDDVHLEEENSEKRLKTSEYEAHVTGESSGQVNEEERGPSTSGNQEQVDDYDFWTDSYASDDDEIPTKQVSQDIMEEVSLTIDEAKLKKMADEMLRQRCTSGDEHQYHIDQMKNFLKSDIFLVIIFKYDDIEERTSRWVNKCVKKFNPYARYGVEHWKNPHAKIFYIRKQKEPGKPKEIVARRANECIVSITEPNYKNLNKNDIEDMYLLIMNGKVPDYAETGLLWSLSVFIRSSVIWERVYDFQLRIESYQQKVNLTTPTISFPRVEKHKMFSIIYEPVHGIIYKNSKKEKRVMRHSEIHKFCDAMLNRVLEGLKSYNNDVKYGYVQRELTNDEVVYLKLFKEEIEVRLKYHDPRAIGAETKTAVILLHSVKQEARAIKWKDNRSRRTVAKRWTDAILNKSVTRSFGHEISSRNYQVNHMFVCSGQTHKPLKLLAQEQQITIISAPHTRGYILAVAIGQEHTHLARDIKRAVTILHEDCHPKGENSAKRQKTSEHGTFVFRESSSSQDFKSEPCPSTLDDDDLPTEKVPQELMDELSHTVDKAKLHKVVDEMLIQLCTSEDEHQYHIDQMQNFLKNDIVWESRKEILVSPHPQRPTPVVQSYQRDPKDPALSLVNQDLLYLKKGSSRPEKIVMSVYKFHADIFLDDDIEEITSRWIVQIIKTYWELGHEHKFIIEIVARRANGSIVLITKSDYKNLNKNDIEDIYLLIVNNKVDDYAKTGLLWSLSVFIRSIVIWERVHDFQLVLEGLKSYNNNVKHGYVTSSLSNEDAEYVQLFEKNIEEQLKHHDEMRHWEIYVNERPLALRKERPE
ncbi:hypothetical protein Tco_0144688 [Tanacetum coccineum]